jgi:hypothetical protein
VLELSLGVNRACSELTSVLFLLDISNLVSSQKREDLEIADRFLPKSVSLSFHLPVGQ